MWEVEPFCKDDFSNDQSQRFVVEMSYDATVEELIQLISDKTNIQFDQIVSRRVIGHRNSNHVAAHPMSMKVFRRDNTEEVFYVRAKSPDEAGKENNECKFNWNDTPDDRPSILNCLPEY